MDASPDSASPDSASPDSAGPDSAGPDSAGPDSAGPDSAGGPLAAVLHAGSAVPGLAAELDLFGRFVGTWDINWLGTDQAGNAISVPGRLVMGWVLGGRAVQDVWQVPLPGQPAPPGFLPFTAVSAGSKPGSLIAAVPPGAGVPHVAAEPVR